MVAISISIIAQVALVAASVVQVHAGALNQLKWVHRRAASSLWVYKQKEAHPTYREDEYETYQIFRARYMAIGCPTQHGTTFFDTCCRARRNNETDADYPLACGITKSIAVPDAAAQVIEAEAYLEAASTSNHSKEQKAFGGAANVTVLLDVAKGNETLAEALPQSALKASRSLEGEGKPTATRATRTFGRSSTATPTSRPVPTPADDEEEERPAAAREAARKAKEDQERQEREDQVRKDREEAERKDAERAAREEAERKKKEDEEEEQQSPAPAPSTGGGDSGGGGLFSNIAGRLFPQGKATFYAQGGAAGACGDVNSDGSEVIAISHALYGGPSDFSVKSPMCGKRVLIQNLDNGKTVTAKIADGCPPCSESHIDLSMGAYDQIGARDTGILNVKFAILD